MIDNMSLLAGTPIAVGKYSIKPWTLREINKFGEKNYNLFLTHLLVTKESLEKSDSINKDLLEKLDIYQVFCGLLLSDTELEETILKGLSITFGMDFFMDKYNGLYYYNSHNKQELFDDTLFEQIRNVFKAQNYSLGLDDSNAFKPANSKARELHEKLQKARKQIQEKNGSEKDGLNISDITSIVACYVDGVNLQTIWDYTIFQLYESYVRLQLWDNYHIMEALSPHMDEEARKKNKHWGIKVTPKTLKEEK